MNLRSVCFLCLLVVALSPQARALTTDDVLGKWSGMRTDKNTVSGRVYREQSSITFTPFRSGGLKVVTRIIRAGFAPFVGTSYYYPNGRITGSATSGGQRVAVARGTWRIQGSTIIEKMTVRDARGSYRSRSTTTFAGNSLTLDEKSPGSHIHGVLNR